MSQRGAKTTWDANNTRREAPLGEGVEELNRAIQVGEWNDLDLTVKGNRIIYAINGHVMTELVDDGPRALGEGVLAMQLHKGFAMEVLFKDVRVRLLNEKAAN